LIRETVDRPMRIQHEPRINPCRGVRAGLFLFIDIFSIKEKIWGSGGRKLTTACKGYYFNVSMSVIHVNKLHHMKYAYGSLPRWFVHTVTDLEKVLDLKTMRFEDVVGRLKAYEERVREEDKANDAHENLLYARTEYSNENNDSRRGRGRGSYSHGRGRGQ
nr:hypothetical protein [Tanacetum cinerariifolium]